MMRLLGLVLVLLVLLCGCAQEDPNITVPSDEATLPATEATEATASGIYVPDSELENETSGAVSCYAVGDGSYGMIYVGDDLALLRRHDGQGVLEVYTGETLEQKNTVSLGAGVYPLPEHFCASEQGLAYYDGIDRAIVFLDNVFREIGRMQMPDDINGAAWLSPDWKTVYYCTAEGLYTLDLQSGISRLLKEHHADSQEVTGMFAGGTILRCMERSADGQTKSALVDASTGALLAEGAHFETLSLWANRYYFARYEGALLRLHFGVGDEPSEILWPQEKGDAYPFLSDDALMMVTPGEDGTKLTYYHMNAGTKLASEFLPDVTRAYGVRGDGAGGMWLLAEDASGAVTLCRWDPSKSAVEETACYKTPCYTAQEPDTDGIARVAKEAKALSERYGIEIVIWTDGAEQAPSDHVFEPEHLTQAYDLCLPQLEQALAIFPEGFFEQASGEEKLKIAIVRSMTGDTEQGSLARSTNLQYWIGKEPVIALAADNNIMRNFLHAVAHLIDTKVLSKSAAFYEWNTINPEGFAYDNNYITNADRTDTAYIEGENPYFIDLFSMSYAKEDRARIFEYACMMGNRDFFQSTVLQEKLRRVCKGIRDAFDLEKVEDTFLWEQYLTT